MLRLFGSERNDARAKEPLEKLSGKLDAYEAILSKQKYLAGDVSREHLHPQRYN